MAAALPTGASAEALARIPKDVKIVDIGGDHRYVERWAYSLADVWPTQIETRALLPRATTGPCLDAARRFYAGRAFVRVSDSRRRPNGLPARTSRSSATRQIQSATW